MDDHTKAAKKRKGKPGSESDYAGATQPQTYDILESGSAGTRGSRTH